MGGGVQRKAADSCVFGGVVWNVGHVGNNPHAHATPHFNPAGSAAKIVVKVPADSKTKRSVLAGWPGADTAQVSSGEPDGRVNPPRLLVLDACN